MASPTSSQLNGDNVEDFSKYLPLYRASLQGNWEEAQNFINQDSTAITAKINPFSHTALHVALGAKNAAPFVEKLVAMMPDEALGLKDDNGHTPLHFAAMYGNVEAAKIIVGRNPDLLYVISHEGLLPLHDAAYNTRNSKDAFRYFFNVTKDDHPPNPYAGPSGVKLLTRLIHSKFYDVAMELVEKYPDLARSSSGGTSALGEIAADESPFINKSRLNFWQTLIYSCISMKPTSRSCLSGLKNGDIENIGEETNIGMLTCCPLPSIFEVRLFRNIRDKMLMHQQAVRLVKCLCKNLETLNGRQVFSLARGAIVEAARLDIHEVVADILETYPLAAYYGNESSQNILHIAIENRCENVFNLVYGMSEHKHGLLTAVDEENNTILHLAGKLAPQHKLNLVSGAALQMQRELQWFQEVEKLTPPYYSACRNRERRTPKMVFTEEHKDLKVEGEKWMKDTANSCTIAAALIVTVVFAAAITVPGGNSGENGLPIFSKKYAFTIFGISNAASLFTSATSLLVFLSILTSRYAEQDFLYALPKSLIIGLLTLFFSIIFMMAAFSATVYLVFGQNKAWVLILVAALACLPVTSFVLLQFPLLVAVISSTYGPGIFDKRGSRQIF